MQMIAQHEAAIALLQASSSVAFRNEPIARRIVITKLQRSGLRIQSNQAAGAGLGDAKNLRGRAIQAIGRGKQNADFMCSAGGTGIDRRIGWLSAQVDSWVNS